MAGRRFGALAEATENSERRKIINKALVNQPRDRQSISKGDNRAGTPCRADRRRALLRPEAIPGRWRGQLPLTDLSRILMGMTPFVELNLLEPVRGVDDLRTQTFALALVVTEAPSDEDSGEAGARHRHAG